MLIDKTIGYWCQNNESDCVDDIAFQLYLNCHFDIYGSVSTSDQNDFMCLRYYHSIYYLSGFYEKAFKISKNLIRKEKLKKLKYEISA